MTNSLDSSSRTTAAVRPAAVLAFPLVYTALGLNSSTCLQTHTFIKVPFRPTTPRVIQAYNLYKADGNFSTLRHILEELALGSARVSDDAHVDVSSQRGPLHGRLGNASEQHQQDAALHLVVSCAIKFTL